MEIIIALLVVLIVIILFPPMLMLCMDIASDILDGLRETVESAVDNWRELIERIFK